MHSQTKLVVPAVALALVAAFLAVSLMFAWTSRRDRPVIVFADPETLPTIVISVSGAIATPGTYDLPGGARLQDAITAAGGLTADADLADLNPALRVRDEQWIVIAAVRPTGDTTGVRGGDTSDGQLDLNVATAAELEALPGIGPTLAARIVAYRVDHGPFAAIEQLALVEGISPRMVDDLRDQITLTT